jgi:hypothetical protein
VASQTQEIAHSDEEKVVASPCAVKEEAEAQTPGPSESSSILDDRIQFTVFPKEEEHPYNARDARNQFVQHNYKYYEWNKVNPHFKTVYMKSFSPKRKQVGNKQR